MPYEEIYELWDLSDLQNILCGFAPKGRITKTVLKRLARYINFFIYDTEGKYNIGKIIKTVKENTTHHSTAPVDRVKIIKSLEPFRNLFYINPEWLMSHMGEKNLVVNVETARSVVLLLMSAIGTIIERFVRSGGVDADNDFWLKENPAQRGSINS